MPDVLDDVLATARVANAGVVLAPTRFAEAIAERLDTEVSAPRGGPALHTNDLYLACACADGDPVALALFEARYGHLIARAVAAAGVPDSERADLCQVVLERMLVGGVGRPPRIAGYSARGELSGWVRVIVAREASRARARTHRTPGGSDDELARRIAPDDPELEYLKRRYREEFKLAFETAVEALDARDRLVLRQHTLDELGIDKLAAIHGVHRATAARWVTSAREAVVEGTRRAMMARLCISTEEMESLVRLIRSQIDVSLPRVLGETAGP